MAVDHLSEHEQLKISMERIENMYSIHKMPFVVTSHIYGLMAKKAGINWCRKYLLENKPMKES